MTRAKNERPKTKRETRHAVSVHGPTDYLTTDTENTEKTERNEDRNLPSLLRGPRVSVVNLALQC
jgi:hypothetical protein